MTDNQKTIDAPSYLSQFGWEKVGNDDLAIPVIVRSNGTRYAPVRIVEQEIIKKFNSLPQTLFQCITLKSFYIMQSEAKLLNSINFNHCNSRYGEAFFTQKDVIISANDVRELKRYLTTSNEIFNQDLGKFAPRLGIVDIALDPYNPAYKSHVPYLGKVVLGPDGQPSEQVRVIPSALVENSLRSTKQTVASIPSDWDVMYLKMLCIYCQNNMQHLISKENTIVSVESLLYEKTNGRIIYQDYRPTTNYN